MRYVSIDLETTGLDIPRCQILEVGAVIDDLEWPDVIGPGPYGGRPHFRVLIDNGRVQGEAFALQMNATILKEIAEGGGVQVASADIELQGFLERNFEDRHLTKGKVTAAGKNVGSFDLPFLKDQDFDRSLKMLHHRSVDPAMLYWQPGDKNCPSLSECLSRAGIAGEVAHTACADAWQVIQLIRHKLIQKPQVNT